LDIEALTEGEPTPEQRLELSRTAELWATSAEFEFELLVVGRAEIRERAGLPADEYDTMVSSSKRSGGRREQIESRYICTIVQISTILKLEERVLPLNLHDHADSLAHRNCQMSVG